MGYEGRKIGPQRNVIEVVHVFAGGAPGHGFGAFTQHRFGDVFYTSKAIDNGFLAVGFLRAKAGTQTAIPCNNRGSAVADDLG